MTISASSQSSKSTVKDLLIEKYDEIEDALQTLRSTTRSDCTGVSWIEPGEENLRILPSGLPELLPLETTPAMPGKTICVYPITMKEPLAITRMDEDVPDGFTPCNFMVAEGLVSYLGYPIPSLDPKIRMVVATLTSSERNWDERDLEYARQAALTIAAHVSPAYAVPIQTRH